MNELSININIAGRVYPITVTMAEEAVVRSAGKLIQEKLLAYGKQFSLRDNQDALAMFALEVSTELEQLRSRQEASELELESKLQEIKTLLSPIRL